MNISWNIISERHSSISEELASADLDQNRRKTLQKEFAHLSKLLDKHQELKKISSEIKDLQSLIADGAESDMIELYKDEIEELKNKYARQEKELEALITPPDPLDDRSVYLEIRAGAGGQEAALFVGDLMRMYTNYAQNKGWRVSTESTSTTDLGGFREVVLHIQGKNIYRNLKKESGVHRVQRVPQTETQGRVHTSTVTVAVLPEAEEVDVNINPSDLRIDVFRASGAGGQHVNTTDSAVRITHMPTGIVVSCQDERSQHKNKNKALKILQSRILAAKVEEHEAKMAKERKDQVGSGMRAEKVRTYNFPQNRVTDHQVDLTLKKLDMVMQGNLEEIIDALVADEQEKRKSSFLKQFTSHT